MVANNPFVVTIRCPAKIDWWAQVIVTPDDNKIIVFNKGKPQGFKVDIPSGGQIHPIPIEGAKVQWKKAQKKEKKNIISEIINRDIPNLIPNCTFKVWFPSNVDSIMTSENQRNK
jgi:hypothetical protein